MFLAAGGPRFFTFENLKAQQAALEGWRAMYPWQTMAAFFALYVAFTSASLPAASLLTILAGAIFGLGWGVLLVSFASAIGALLAMLAARFVLRDWVQDQFGAHLRGINEGIAREGGFYLFTLRLIPAVPYFLINLAMGLTPIRPWTFYWVSQVAMFPATVLYVNAGTQLARLESLRDVLSWQLIGALVLLGIFPLAAKKAIELVKARRVYARWPRPRRFDRNLIVIGAGSAGLVAAYIAAAVRARVTLVEKQRMGGDCLYTGCVPSKALIKSARVLSTIRNAKELRHPKSATADFDFADVMERVQRVIRAVEPHDSAERYTQLGVECIQGNARITSPWTVEIDGKPLTTRAIVIAAGARPLVPKIPGIENVQVLTSENVWELRKLPGASRGAGRRADRLRARAGVRALRLESHPGRDAAAHPRARGSRKSPRWLRRAFAPKASMCASAHRAVRVENQMRWSVSHAGETVSHPLRLIAVRARAGAEYQRLRARGARHPGDQGAHRRDQRIPADALPEHLRLRRCGRSLPVHAHRFAPGVVRGGERAVRKFPQVPRRLLGDSVGDVHRPGGGARRPERERGGRARHRLRSFALRIDELDRAIADEAAYGMVKVLTVPGRDRILGATIVGEHAGDLIVEFITAMKHGIGLNKILGTIHIYPTLAEANKYAAGVWKKAHAPQGVLKKLERFHAWMRG